MTGLEASRRRSAIRSVGSGTGEALIESAVRRHNGRAAAVAGLLRAESSACDEASGAFHCTEERSFAGIRGQRPALFAKWHPRRSRCGVAVGRGRATSTVGWKKGLSS